MKRSIIFGTLVTAGLLFGACAENTRNDEDGDMDLTADEIQSEQKETVDQMMYDPYTVEDERAQLTDPTPGADRYQPRPQNGVTSPSVFQQSYDADTEEMEEASLFVKEAMSAAILGTLMADLAIRHSDDPEVEALAKSVKKDYAKANAQLHRIAESENWYIPVELTPEDQQKVYDLQHKVAAEYPDVYIDWMIAEHKESIAQLNRYCERNDDALADWSEKQIAMLRKHTVRGEQVENQLASNQ
jgi:predicted outer membrane protein